MARWDEILSLPVQNPPAPEFSAADIVWSRVEGWRENMDRLALIPFTRVNDFLRGEANNKECPTRFHVEARRRRPKEMSCKKKVDGILEYILYWCSFGPDDHRQGGAVRPSRTNSGKRKTPAGRPNTKRGCTCHFIVKRLIAEPTVALVIYNQDKHVDKKGLPCHGPQDKKAAGTRAMFAPYISDEFRHQLMSLLYVGVPVETIMQKHTEMVEKQGGPCNVDHLLSHRYVRRLERKIRRSTYELDADDAVSLGAWVESHQDHVFHFEDFSNSEGFVLGIQTEWQLQQMIRFGNLGILACDSKFGSNKLKYPVCSLLVFDSNNKAIPVAWVVTPDFASGEIYRWMGSLYVRARSKDPTWRLGGFIIDEPSADVPSIREAFKCSVLISFWRVRHAWHKNLMKKCSETDMRAEMLRRLGEVVSNICRGNGDMNLFEAFTEDFIDCSDFLDYFMAIWFPKIGAWTTVLKSLPLASTEVSAAMECYHHQLKLRLLNEKDSHVFQRVDWLVDKLGTEVHSYYWLDEYAEKDSFARYWKDEWKSSLTAWRQALQIPDSDVVLDVKCAKVPSRTNPEKVRTVLNPGSEFAMCDCVWSKMGYLCKHVIKSTRLCRDRGLATPSTSLFGYNRILRSILNCPPHDSIIRDHALAMAVSVQTQLNTIFGHENSSVNRNVSVPRENQETVVPRVSETENLGNADRDVLIGNQFASENSNDDLRNKNHSSTLDCASSENVNISEQNAIFNQLEAPLNSSPPIEQHFAGNSDIMSYTKTNEEATVGPHVSKTENLGNADRDVLTGNQFASENSYDALRNKNHSSTLDCASSKNVSISEQNAIFKQLEASPNSSPPIEKHFAGNRDIMSYTTTNEEANLLTQNQNLGSPNSSPPIEQHFAGNLDIMSYATTNKEANLLTQNQNLGSTMCNTPRIGDEPLDDMVADSRTEELTAGVTSVDQPSYVVLEHSVAEKMINIDPQSFPSTSMSEVGAMVLEMPDVLMNSENLCDNSEGHPCESMTVEVSTGFSSKVGKQSLTARTCKMNSKGYLNLDKDKMDIEKVVVDAEEKNCNGDQTIHPDTIDYSCFLGDGTVRRMAMQNNGTCKHGEEVVHKANTYVSETNFRTCTGVHVLGYSDTDEKVQVDQVMDSGIAEVEIHADSSLDEREQLSSVSVAACNIVPPEVTNSEQGSSDFGKGVILNAEIPNMMDIEISTYSVQEINIGQSSVWAKDGVVLAMDVDPVLDGVSSNT